MANAVQWFYAHAGKQSGPVDEATFRAMAMRGEIAQNDLVWKSGMAHWAEASTVPELFPAPAQTPAPGEPPPLPLPAPPLSSQRMVGYFAPPPPSDPGNDAKMRMLMPVGRTGLSIAAGYLGLFSVIPIFAPIAVIISLMAIRELRRKPNLHGMGRAVFGLVMGFVMSALALIGILAAVSR